MAKKTKEKGKGLWAEFKEFLMQGDVMTMAVGIIIGGAFTAIVNSLVDDILNPIIALIGGDAVKNISELGVHLGKDGPLLTYGHFLGAIINFLIVGLVLFLIIKAFNRAKAEGEKLKKTEKEEAVEEAPAAPTEAELLSEIVTLLKEQNADGNKTE